MNVKMVLLERSFPVELDWHEICKNPRENDQITSLQNYYKVEDAEMLIKDSSITLVGSLFPKDKSYECGNGLIQEVLFCSIWLIQNMTKFRTSEVTKKLKILRSRSKIAVSPLLAYCSWTRAAMNVGMVPFGRSLSVVSDLYEFLKNSRKKI